MTICYLRVGSDYLDDAYKASSIKDAVAEYRAIVDECNRFGNTSPEASIHIPDQNGDVHEYPDFVLSAGPRGGVKKEST